MTVEDAHGRADVTDSPRAVCIDPMQVHQVWPHVAHRIEQAIARGGLADFDAIARDVLDGRSLLWLAWDPGSQPGAGGAEILGAAVTQLERDRDGRKLCTIVGCGGHTMARWVFLIAELERHARAEGCAAMRIYGRKGWARVLNRIKTGVNALSSNEQTGVNALSSNKQTGVNALSSNEQTGVNALSSNKQTSVNALLENYRVLSIVLEKELP